MASNGYRSAAPRVVFVPEANVKGRASVVWLSLGPNGIRWDRIGVRL